MSISRRSRHLLEVAVLGAGLLGTTPAHAHFILTSPPAVSEQNFLGDPQKAPPCGDDGSAVVTGISTDYQGGDVVTITIDETIFHPGHYRIALAVNDISELPEEPPVTPNDTPCGTVPIQNPPVFPVLADGVFLHDKPFAGPQSFDLTLPADVSCTNCTLQIIQFMSNHGLNNPGGCFYHHCATISVQGGAGTTGSGESGEGTTASSMTSMTTTASSQGETASDESTAGATGTATGDAPTSGAPTTEDASSSAAATASDTSTDGATNDSGGCGCSGAREGHGPTMLALVLGSLGLRARRRP